ncbi:MAG: 4-hydroxybutyrate CoA-transferase, partial [Chitinophagaceae bacterium]|nr:4-hydroxybutyrate CoA-transferase [Chitinophagaceae bacterium]
MVHPYKYVSATEALSLIQSNQRVFVHGSACTPIYLLHELAKEKDRLNDVEIVSITLRGDIEIDKPEYQSAFHINSMFVSASVRNAVK